MTEVAALLFGLIMLTMLAVPVVVVGAGLWLGIAEARRPALAPTPDPEPGCACGSQADPVPVEVRDTLAGAEVVGWLCPDCGEAREPDPERSPEFAAESRAATTVRKPRSFVLTRCVGEHSWEQVVTYGGQVVKEFCADCGIRRR